MTTMAKSNRRMKRNLDTEIGAMINRLIDQLYDWRLDLSGTTRETMLDLQNRLDDNYASVLFAARGDVFQK